MDDRVPARREIIVSSILIVVRASLVAVTRGLVAIRPSLILIARRLVAIRRCLIPVRRRNQKICATCRTDRHRRRLPAVRTHELDHSHALSYEAAEGCQL
jgi:hypothetical protein